MAERKVAHPFSRGIVRVDLELALAVAKLGVSELVEVGVLSKNTIQGR